MRGGVKHKIARSEKKANSPVGAAISRLETESQSKDRVILASWATMSYVKDMHSFEELSEVVLAQPIEVQGVSVPAGARGIVMAAWADGLAYEVEFTTPQHAVLTVEGADLKA